MSYNHAGKPNHNPRAQFKYTQAHFDAKHEIMRISRTEQTFGWTYSRELITESMLGNWLLDSGAGICCYHAYTDADGTTVLDILVPRFKGQQLPHTQLTPEILHSIIGVLNNGKRLQLRVSVLNSDIRTSRGSIPNTTYAIANVVKLDEDQLKVVSTFYSQDYRRIGYADLEAIAIEQTQNKESKLSELVPQGLLPRQFVTEVMRAWNRI